MNIKKICKIFQNETVCVVGQKGTGKDVLFGNVINRRKLPYISNTDYGGEFLPLQLEKLFCGGNTYRNFINGNIQPYFFPYEDDTDVYVADVGVYFPSQYCNELNRDYKSVPVFEALSRHLGKGTKLHINVQNLNRCWDKLREMSDCYIRCRWCKVFCGFVIQKITIYDKYESCVNRVEAFLKMRPPLGFNREQRRQFKVQQALMRQNYTNTHGSIKNHILVYRNKSKHDTRVFKKILEGGFT